MWIYVPLYIASITMNKKFNDYWFNHIVGSSYILYLIHYPLILIPAALFVKHLKDL